MSEAADTLKGTNQSNPEAPSELLSLVYGELRKLAAARMATEPDGHTLQPTALVHEAWLRLVRTEQSNFQNRAHFFAAAAEAMRRILIDTPDENRRNGGGAVWRACNWSKLTCRRKLGKKRC